MLHKTFSSFPENKMIWLNESPENNSAPQSVENIVDLNKKSEELGKKIDELLKDKDNIGLKNERIKLETEHEMAKRAVEEKYGAEKAKLALGVADTLQKYEAKDNAKIQNAEKNVEDFQEAEVRKLRTLSAELNTRPLVMEDVQTIHTSVDSLFGEDNEIIGPEELSAMKKALNTLRDKVAKQYSQESYQDEMKDYEKEVQTQKDLENQIKKAGNEAVIEAKKNLPEAPTKYLKFQDAESGWVDDESIDFGYNPSTGKISIRVKSDGNWKNENLLQELQEKKLDTKNFTDFITEIENLNKQDVDGETRQEMLAQVIQRTAKNSENCLFEDQNGRNLWGDTWSTSNKEAPKETYQIIANFDQAVNLDEIRSKAEQEELAKIEKDPAKKELLGKRITKPEQAPIVQTEQVEQAENPDYIHKNIPGNQEEFDAMIEAEYGTGYRAQAMKAIVDIMAKYVGIPNIERTNDGRLVMAWFGSPDHSPKATAEVSPENTMKKISTSGIEDSSLRTRAESFIADATEYISTTIDRIDMDKYAENIQKAIDEMKNGGMLAGMEEGKRNEILEKYVEKAGETDFKKFMEKSLKT